MTKEDQFEAFWKMYPRRIGKGTARKAFDKALKLAPADEIIRGLAYQLPYYASKESQFIPHPSTWLNGERWADEPQMPEQKTAGRRTAADAARDFNARFDHLDTSFGVRLIGRH